MSKSIRFVIEVPRKRERNALVIAQAKGEAQKPRREESAKHKQARLDKRDWRKDCME